MSQFVIGLVGGIASGKSEVASLVAEERAATHVNADAIARRVLGRPAVQEALIRRIPGARSPDGTMDRDKLAKEAFSRPQALAALEEIMHPLIRKALVLAIRRARTKYVLVDAPLLQETGADALCDAVVYVACPARTRRARARRDRGWTNAEHAAREASQWSCRRKRAQADFVVDNSTERKRTRQAVRRVLRAIEEGI